MDYTEILYLRNKIKMENKKDISNIKNELSSLKSEKDKLKIEKEELSKTTKDLIDKAKDLKKNKDQFNMKLNQLKKTRDEYNSKVKELVTKIKEVQKKKKDIYSKQGIKGDPDKLHKQIKDLRMMIETEVLSFDKEKKLMEQIKRLEKQYDECKDVKIVNEEYNKLSKAIEENKKLGEEAHQKVKEFLKANKKGYKEFIALTKKITNMKSQQERIYSVFKQVKDKFDSMNQSLRSRLGQITHKKVEKQQKEEIKIKKHEEKIIKEKVSLVEEKIKKKKKLTTEDLIAYQGKDLEKEDE